MLQVAQRNNSKLEHQQSTATALHVKIKTLHEDIALALIDIGKGKAH